MPTLQAWLPRAVDLSVMTDRSESIRASVREVELSLLISIGLIVAMVFVFLRRLWATFAAAVTMALSIAGQFNLDFLDIEPDILPLTFATGAA
jgi:multidrug efflux pump subunit AcrB